MGNTDYKKQIQHFVDKNAFCDKFSDTRVLTVIEWKKRDYQKFWGLNCLFPHFVVKVHCSQCKKTFNDLIIDIDEDDGSLAWG